MSILEIKNIINNSSSDSIDINSLKKLIEEIGEFNEEYSKGDNADKYNLMHELADIVYYCFKVINYYSSLTNEKIEIEDAIKICIIKYTTRHKNNKNIELEKKAIKEVF